MLQQSGQNKRNLRAVNVKRAAKIMALLRDASHAVSRTDALTTASADAVQAARAVDSSVTDGLIVEVDAAECLRFPRQSR